MKRVIAAAALAVVLGTPLAHAQGIIGDAVNGAVGVANGAVGVAGGVAGAAVGTARGVTRGVLGVDDRPRFREYAVGQGRPSYAWDRDVRVGAVLPGRGVTYYDVPPDYRTRGYRYTVVNGRVVVVDPVTRRIVELVD